MTDPVTDAPGPPAARARRAATVRFLLALIGLSLGVLGATVVAGLVVWQAMDASVREAALAALADRVGVLVFLALVTVAGVAAVLTVPFRRYVIPALRLEEEGRLMLEVHTRHRIEPDGADELRRIAVLLNDFADRHSALRADVEQQVAEAAAELTAQRDRLSALVAQLPQGLLVCNGGGRIVLYNDRVQTFWGDGDRFVGLDRPVYDLIDRATIDAARAQARRSREAGEEAPGATFVTSVGDLLVRVHVAEVAAEVDGTGDGFVLLIEPIVDASRDEHDLPPDRIQAHDLLAAVREDLARCVDVTVAVVAPSHPFSLRVDLELLQHGIRSAIRRVVEDGGIRDLTVGVAGVEGYAHLDVSWQGAPSAAEVEHLTSAPFPGPGGQGDLALSDIAEAHLGSVLVTDMCEAGTSLRFLLPISDPGGAQPAPQLQRRGDQYDFRLLRAADRSSLDDVPLTALTCTVFDTETTGLQPSEGDEIVSIGAIRLVAGRLLAGERFVRLVDPRRPIPAASARIHGITDEMVEGQPPLEEVVPAFARFCADTVLIGHAVAFDLRFLELAEPLTGVRLTHPVLDTLLLSAAAHPNQRSHTLDAVAARLGVEVIGRHTAVGDALATAEVFLRLLPLLSARGIVTLGQARAASLATPMARIVY